MEARSSLSFYNQDDCLSGVLARRRSQQQEIWGSFPAFHHLVGLVVKASASRAEDLGFDSHFHRGIFLGLVLPVT